MISQKEREMKKKERLERDMLLAMLKRKRLLEDKDYYGAQKVQEEFEQLREEYRREIKYAD